MTDKKKSEGAPVTGLTFYIKGRRPERITKAEAAKRLDTANGVRPKPETDMKNKSKSER